MTARFVAGLRRVNRATRQLPRVRRAGVALYTNVVRLNVFLDPPRVILNGPAKSGTHLLSDCLSLLPRMMFSGRHFVPGEFGERGDLDVARLRRYLDRCPQGMFVTTHAPAWSEVRRLFTRLGFRHVLLIRDPRDMVVSFAHWVAAEPHLPRHRYYADVLQDHDKRLMATITGYDDGRGNHLPSIASTLDDYLPWLEEPGVLVCRYEDLVGERVGTSSERQRAAVRRIAEFVGRPIDEGEADAIATRMYGAGGLTFRAGRSGDWRDEFGDEHREAFKEVAGRHLVTLGYEADSEW